MKKRCVIICAFQAGSIRSAAALRPDDFILCADAGYALARAERIRPDLVIGDFDSLQSPGSLDCPYIELPRQKNDTDTMACVKYGIEKGFDAFLIVGGIGGRLDQTLANVQTLAYACARGKTIAMTDGQNYVTMIQNASLRLPRKEGFYLSLLSYSQVCRGVFAAGVKYPLENADLTQAFPLGVSNEFAGEEAEISVREGWLLILLSRDRTPGPGEAPVF